MKKPTAQDKHERELTQMRNQLGVAVRSCGTLSGEKHNLEQLLRPLLLLWEQSGRPIQGELAIDPAHLRRIYDHLGGVPAEERIIPV